MFFSIFRHVLLKHFCSQMTIAYHGQSHNYSSLAVEAFAKQANIKSDQIPISTYEALLSSNHQYCFLAVQNSSHTLSDMFRLIEEHQWNVVAEYYWSKSLQLVSTGTDIAKIKHIVVVGHIAFVCKQFLEQTKVHVIHVEDTAEACQYILDKKSDAYAAICPKETATHFNLNTIVQRVDDPNSMTRFFLVSKSKDVLNTQQPFKTTLLVRIQNRAGSLHKAIGCFATRDINICQIESFPSSKATNALCPWEHYFCLDVQGTLKETKVQRAIENLQEFCTKVTVLGSYPVYVHDQEMASVGL